MKELFAQFLCSLFQSQERLSTEMGRFQGGRSLDKVGLKRTVLNSKSERSQNQKYDFAQADTVWAIRHSLYTLRAVHLFPYEPDSLKCAC